MTFPTVNVTISLTDFVGAPHAGIKITAKLDRQDSWSDGDGGGIIVPEVETATTDENGVAVMPLFPNNPTTGLGETGSIYRFHGAIDDGPHFRAKAQIPNTNCNLHDVLMDEPMPSLTSAQIAVSHAQQYAAQAQGAQSAAASSADAAAGSAIAAATSEGNAAATLAGAVRHDTAQSLTAGQKAQARSNISLDQVDNTSDESKPVSSSQQSLLGLKAATITFMADGSIVETGADLTVTTTFAGNVVAEAYSGSTAKTVMTTFNSDGSITRGAV